MRAYGLRGRSVVAVRPFVRRGSDAWLMATVALGIVLDNVGAVHLRQGAARLPVGLLRDARRSSRRRSASIRCSSLIPVVGLALAVGAASLLLARTRRGKALLAVVQNADAARLMGINVERVSRCSFALSTPARRRRRAS